MAKQLFCPSCGNIGAPKTLTPGSILIELVLWICFIVPGLIYSLWRITSKKPVCPHCGQNGMIPKDSPIAKGRMTPIQKTFGVNPD